MNKLSGYKEFTLASGKTIELKFCNGSTEIFAELMGLNSLKDVDAAPTVEAIPELDGAGNPVLDENNEPVTSLNVTATYLKALRLFIYAAALYAARVQNKPVDFNEWTPSEWIEEIGTASLMAAIDKPEADPKKNEAQPEAVAIQ